MLTLQMKESAQQWGDHKRAPLLNLLFFGSPEITLGGEPVTGFVSAKAKALLCLLAITRRVQSRNALVALFWGDVPEADAKTQLRVALSNLRKLVGDHLQIERETVAFDTTQAYHLDVEEFEKQLADSRLPIAKQDSLSAISQLLSANRAYRGDLLAGMLVRDAPEFEEWLLVQRERLCGMALDGLWTLFQLERARGNTAAALDALKRSVELEPWREEAHREVMLLLARTGKRSAALQQFETCRAVLQRELGVEPASETVHLYERIRAAGTDPRHNLPSPATSFVGRETELQTIVQRLETETRLLTLLGPGGIGKTRLALQAARQQVDRFLNGVFFVSLAQAQDADAVLAAIAHALAFSFSGGEAPRTQLLNYLQEKELLLVLDNFEHLHDGAELVREILARETAVRVLVTSRERLNLRAEWLLSVRGLPMTQTGADTGAPSAALRLFAERAAQVAPDFDFEHEAAQVHHICALVEGMPLAIELAATWRRMYSADEIVQQIKIDLDFLATTQTDVPAAHSSLRAVFARSWEMLSPREQGAFRGLAVFRGSFTSEAARHVAAIAPPTLQALADKSLVSTLPREASDPGLRFGMHELLRQYALAQFAYAEQQAAALHDKHSAYYAEKLAAQETALKGADTKNAVVGLARDGENIVAAWEWASARTPPDAIVLARMVEPLMVLLELRGEYLAAERLYAHTAAQLEDQNAPNQASEIILARVLTGQSWFCFRLAQFEQGRALSARAFSLLQKHDAWQHTAYPLLIGGANEFGAGNLAAAREMTASSVEVYRRSQDAFGIAGALNNLGQITTALGEFDAAENYLRASLEVARRAGIKMLQCSALENLGALEFQRGELVQAQRDLEECLTLARETGDPYETATTQNSLARVLVARGETQTAAALLQDAENTWRKLGDRWSLANTLLAAAQVQRALNQPLPAEGLYWSALETAHAINATTMVLNVLAGIAELRAARGEMDFAREWCAVVVQHPAAEAATRERAMQCFAKFTATLDADAIQALRTRAAQRDLRTAVAQLLDQRA